MNRWYFGDTLRVLGEHAANVSADLVHVDPSCNAVRGHKLRFKKPKGQEADAQITSSSA